MIFTRYNRRNVARVLFAAMFSITLLPAVQAHAEAASEVTSVYKKIASYHLPSLAQKELAEQAFAQELAKANAERIEKKELSTVAVPVVGEAEKMRIIYDIFNSAENKQAQDLIDENVVNDLNLLCGDKSNPESHVFSKVDRTQTAFGKVELQRMLAQPLSDIAALQQRQAVVQKLISDETLFNTLDTQLKTIKMAETDMLWFWKQLDESVKQFLDQIYPQADGFDATSEWNKSSAFMQLHHNWKTIGAPTATALTYQLYMALIIASMKAQWAFSDSYRTNYTNEMQDEDFRKLWKSTPDKMSLLTTPFDWTYRLGSAAYETLKDPNTPTSLKTTIGVGIAVPVAYVAYQTYKSLQQASQYNSTAGTVHDHMMPVGSYAQTLDDVLVTITASPELAAMLPEHKELAAFNKAINDETQSLVDALKTSTFKGESSFFSLRGRVLASFKKMFTGKNHFVSSMQTIGKLDAYLSIAKLYKEQANNGNARYCFVSYETADKPHLKAVNFWVPMLNPNTVVTNSIEMGGVNPRDIIVTGPNAGGKSTALKGVIDAIVLAQTLGIAPASEMTLTPFTIIKSYMNIADTTGSASLFQAEMRRTQGLLESIKALLPGQFAFIIMDEIFTGTNHREGQAGAFGVVKKIANYDNCICFFATHFKKLTELETILPGVVSNCKVMVTKNADSSFTFPYKLAPGITDQAIALDLLAQEGFDADVLQAAQEALGKA